jgi:hypothetical protein
MLRPAVKRTIEQIFSGGEYLWDRNRFGERIQHHIDDVHHGQRSPQKTQAKLVNTLFVPTLVM